MGSTLEALMKKRADERLAAVERKWDGGKGSLVPDFDPTAAAALLCSGGGDGGSAAVKATRATEELLLAATRDDAAAAYEALERGGEPSFVFGEAYGCRPGTGYTALMAAAHRGHVEPAKAMLRAGADPNKPAPSGDLPIFWAIDGGAEMLQLFVRYGADLDNSAPAPLLSRGGGGGGGPSANSNGNNNNTNFDPSTLEGVTPLSYAIAKGKYGATEDAGVYPEDILRHYGAKTVGAPPGGEAPPPRSPRESFSPASASFRRERGSYQAPMPHP